MEINAPLNIWLINQHIFYHLRIGDSNPHFKQAASPQDADLIIFEDNHSSAFIRNSAEYKQWPDKCVGLIAADQPDFFLPGCYCSNYKHPFSKGRAKTIHYLRMQREGPNPYIKAFTDSPYKYLYAFRGGSTSWLRKKMFKILKPADDVYVSSSNHYHHWSLEQDYMDQKTLLQKEYAELLEQSLFFLCPRGAGSSSIRLFEVMEAGRVPVIISDNWIPVEGINWDEFSIRVAEKDIDKIDSIIRARAADGPAMGKKALQVYQENFAIGPDLALLARSYRQVQADRNPAREKFIHSLFPILEASRYLKQKGFKAAKFLVLKALALTGRKLSYELNRPA